MLKKLSDETRDARTVILSSEIIWHTDPIHPGRLDALFRGFDEISLLFYIRRQDSFAVSYWGSDIKFRIHKEMPHFEQYCRHRNFDFLADLERWEANGGGARLIVRPFVREAWKNKKLLDDFFHYIDERLKPVTSVASDNRNESWPIPSLELLRMINMLDLPNPDKLAVKLRELGAGISVGENQGLLTQEIQQYLLDRYAARNRMLADRYWTPEEKRLFDEQEVRTYEYPYSGLTTENYSAILAELWSEGHPDKKTNGLPDQYADIFRNAALKIEKEDLKLAFELMNLAHEIRPAGTMIKQKLDEYREKLNQ